MSDPKDRPTGYTITMSPEVLYIWMRCFGKTCSSDRIERFNVTKESNTKAQTLYQEVYSKLVADNYLPDDEDRKAEFLP